MPPAPPLHSDGGGGGGGGGVGSGGGGGAIAGAGAAAGKIENGGAVSAGGGGSVVVVVVVLVVVLVDVDVVVERFVVWSVCTLAESSDELPLNRTADVDAPAMATTSAPPTSHRRTFKDPTRPPAAACPSSAAPACIGHPPHRLEPADSLGSAAVPVEPVEPAKPATAATPRPSLDVLAPPPSLDGTDAVALVLHGGRERSREPVQPGQLAVRRMRPFARALATAGRDLDLGLAVWSLRYRVRGWNDDEQSPVADATWALDQLTERVGPVPVVIVGHSMGGRTAVHVAGHDRVVGLAALAPWLPPGEPVDQVAGRAVLVAHGTLDTVTSPVASQAWAARAAEVTEPVWWVGVRRERHAMVLRSRVWHALATQFALHVLGARPLPRALGDARDARDARLHVVV